jgi:hypothetical protein
VFLYKYGALEWLAAAFNVHRVPEPGREFPGEPGEGMSWWFTAVLVDSKTRIVRAMHPYTATQKLSTAIWRAIQAQLALPPDDAQHERELDRLNGRSEASLAAEAHVRYSQKDRPS